MWDPKDGRWGNVETRYIPAGKFLMGDDDSPRHTNDNPRHTVELTAYRIYKNVVTVGQYSDYCKATGKRMPPDYDDDDGYEHIFFNKGWSKRNHPIVNVDWFEARAYAQWAGGDLPSEAQWERAARGTDGRKFPWGDDFDSSKCCCSYVSDPLFPLQFSQFQTTAVGKYGVSPDGCTDMAGNVEQWCLDWYEKRFWKSGIYASASRQVNPVNESVASFRVLRGDTWFGDDAVLSSCSDRGCSPPDSRSEKIGFRVVFTETEYEVIYGTRGIRRVNP